MKLFLFVLLFPVSAFSQELQLANTKWSLSAVGCRKPSLSPSSHRSKPISSGDITAGTIELIGIDRIEMTAKVQGNKQTQRGTYSRNGDELIWRGGPPGTLPMYIQEDRKREGIEKYSLVYIGSGFESMDNCACPYKIRYWPGWRSIKREIEESGEETWEEHKRTHEIEEEDEWIAGNSEEFRELRHKCREDYPFVYVLGRTK